MERKLLFPKRIREAGRDREPVMRLREAGGVPFFSFPSLAESGLVAHGFSTRLGGASRGDFATMNFSFTRGDRPEDVRENFRRMAGALEVSPERMVLSWQTHTTNVRRVTEADAGKGIFCDRDYRDVDGLITDVPGLTLVTLYADCIPLFFLDPVRRAIGLSHSGWRGTVSRMGAATIRAMKEAFGSRPEDLIACIGPGICGECYEVGPEVAQAFQAAFQKKDHARILRPGTGGKWYLNLHQANRIILEESGIRPQHLSVADLCTCCNPDLFFSHRKHGERRGNLGAFLCLRP